MNTSTSKPQISLTLLIIITLYCQFINALRSFFSDYCFDLWVVDSVDGKNKCLRALASLSPCFVTLSHVKCFPISKAVLDLTMQVENLCVLLYHFTSYKR